MEISADSLEFLKLLVEMPGVPGREDRVRALLQSRAERHHLFDELRTDALGSLIGVRKPRPAKTNAHQTGKRIILSAHMDQVGFLVSHISADGYLRLHPVGAFDPRTLVSQRVRIVTEDGSELTGILVPEGHPVHTAPEGDQKSARTMRDFYVDLGGDRYAAEKVRLGDMSVFKQSFEDLGQSIAGPALDNRLGCWALMTSLENLVSHDCEIVAVWSSQEELGSRGIQPVSFATRVDVGISCDTVSACDVPGVPEEERVCQLGAGVALVVADSSTLADMTLVRELESIAQSEGIATQRCLMEGGGQDGAYIQRARDGVKTAVISCPVRYMHTSNEIASKADLVAYSMLLTGFLRLA